MLKIFGTESESNKQIEVNANKKDQYNEKQTGDLCWTHKGELILGEFINETAK